MTQAKPPSGFKLFCFNVVLFCITWALVSLWCWVLAFFTGIRVDANFWALVMFVVGQATLAQKALGVQSAQAGEHQASIVQLFNLVTTLANAVKKLQGAQ